MIPQSSLLLDFVESGYTVYTVRSHQSTNESPRLSHALEGAPPPLARDRKRAFVCWDAYKHDEGGYSALVLQSGNPAECKTLSDLYEPALVLFAPNAFVLRGYERLDTPEGQVGVVREWQCKIRERSIEIG